MTESRWSRVAPLVVGGLMLMESLALLGIAMLTAIIGSLAGALAIGAGAGGASGTRVAQGIGVIALTLITPFVVAGAVGFGGFLLLVRIGRPMIFVSCSLALAAQILFHFVMKEGFHPVELFPVALHVTAIALAALFVHPRPKQS